MAKVPLPIAITSRIARFVTRLDRLAPTMVEAVWIGGSIALGDHQRGSDIDLVIATRGALDARTRRRARIGGVDPVWLVRGVEPRGLDALAAATVFRCGIAVRGPEAREVVDDLDREELAAIMRANLVSYWRPWLARARGGLIARLAGLHPRRVQWAVLGVPRQWVTITTGAIVSKTAAALAMRAQVEPRWHRILDDAIGMRRGERSRYASPFARRRDMLAWLAYAIERTAAA